MTESAQRHIDDLAASAVARNMHNNPGTVRAIACAIADAHGERVPDPAQPRQLWLQQARDRLVQERICAVRTPRCDGCGDAFTDDNPSHPTDEWAGEPADAVCERCWMEGNNLSPTIAPTVAITSRHVRAATTELPGRDRKSTRLNSSH